MSSPMRRRTQQLTGRAQELPPSPARPPAQQQQQQQPGSSSTAGMAAVLEDPEMQLAIFFGVVVLMGAYVILRILRALLFFGPLAALGLACLKPDVGEFEEVLRLLERRREEDAHPPTSSSGWIMSLIDRTSALLQRNPVKEWVYWDAGVAIVGHKKGSQTFAFGAARHWAVVSPDLLGDRPWFPVLHQGGCFLLATLPTQLWRPFPLSPSSSTRHLQAYDRVDAVLSATAAAAGNVLTSAAAAAPSSSSSFRTRSPHSPRRRGNNSPPRSPPRNNNHQEQQRPIREWMRRAQALAESGRFVDASAVVEEGIARCASSGSLRGRPQEEMELWVVAAAFYEAQGFSVRATTAGGGGFLGRLRCLQKAGEVAACDGQFARAAELLDEGAQAWYDERRKGTPFGLVASGKAAPLVLGSILAQLACGDHVKAQQLYRLACAADRATAPGFPRTPQGELAAAVLEAVRAHDARALGEACARFNNGGKHRLDAWQEEAVALLRRRIESGAHLR